MVTEGKIVIGANYGDEGKGLATRYFTLKAKKEGKSVLNVLFNGGCQRGHTADFPDGRRHIFHHFGSGTFDGADTYFASKFIVNPMEFVREVEEIRKEMEQFPRCFISPSCRVSTPYDMIINRIVEESRGENRHGSCGLGIWETTQRLYQMELGDIDAPYDYLRFEQMAALSDGAFMELMFWISHEYLPARLKQYGISDIPEPYEKIIESHVTARNYLVDFRAMQKLCGNGYHMFPPEYDAIIYEGGQGLALSEGNRGEWPHVTASDTGAAYAIDDFLDAGDMEICYVMRPYLTRHGAGDLPGECDPKSFIQNFEEDKTNIPNPYQGELRYAPLDENMLERVCADFKKQKTTVKPSMSIFMTHMNEASDEMADWIVACPYTKKTYLSWSKYAEEVKEFA